jgi:putative peptidoglycan lipid II flippase
LNKGDTAEVPVKRASLGRTFGLVAILTVLSKVVGLVRDMVVASAYGTSILADAYNYAYLFTGNILILFGGLGGPFHSATVATLTPQKNDQKAGLLMSQVMIATMLALTAIAVLLYWLAPDIVHLIAGGYGHNVTDRQHFFAETISQLRIMSPLVVIAGLIGVSYGILNVFDKVFWPSLSPALASIAIIAALLICPNRATALPLAIGTLIGAVLQLLAQLPGMFKCGLKYELSPKPTEGLANYTSMLWPAVFGTSIGQLTIYVDSFFSSTIGEGAWTAISNANRLVQLPLGVLITAMLVPMLPRFTEHASGNRIDDLKEEFRRALRFLWFLSAPLTVILLVIPQPIIQLLFQRGAFNQRSTNLVTTALLLLAPSIVFYIGRDLITRVFYAFQDSKTPYYIAIVAICLKAFLDWYFVVIAHMGVGGISLATTLVTISNLGLLTFLLRHKIGKLGFTQLLRPICIMVCASVVCGFLAYGIQLWLATHIHIGHLFSQLVSVGLSSAIGLSAYLLVCLALKLEEPQMLFRRLLKRQL